MFNCQVDLLNHVQGEKVTSSIPEYIDKYFKFNGDEGLANENYSSDNMESVYLWCFRFKKEWIENLPLKGHHSKNPFDYIFFYYIKHPIIGLIYYPLIFIDVVLAGMKPYKVNQRTHKLERDTSGKLKSFFKMRVLNMFVAKRIVDFFIYHSSYYKSWFNIFCIYHPSTHRVHRAFIRTSEDDPT